MKYILSAIILLGTVGGMERETVELGSGFIICVLCFLILGALNTENPKRKRKRKGVYKDVL